MSNKEMIILQVPLRGVIADKFDDLYKVSGFENRTEYIRYLINKESENAQRTNNRFDENSSS